MTTATAAITKDQERFYSALFADSQEFMEIRLIQGNKAKSVFLTLKELMQYPTPADSNVYIGIFQRGKKGNGKIENCTQTSAIYLDFDDMKLDEIQYRIDMASLPQPSMIVNSGHGYHCYWLLEKAAGKEVQPVIKAMQVLLNADPKAVDPARILRVPDTMNLKGEPVACQLVHSNDHRTPLQVFEDVLKVKALTDSPERLESVQELLEIRFNGLNNMAAGVEKGERNFCTGRIVQTLKRLNYTKQEASDIVFRWNILNQPKKAVSELKREINVFWHESQYKYDGKEFSDSALQELNARFIDSRTTFFNAQETETHNYDNELLSPKNFQEASGLTFAILSIVKLAESDGIRREQIANLCKRDKADRNVKTSLKLLEKMEYLVIKKKNRTNFYMFNEKANYKRGYTAIGKSLHRSFIHGELKEHEYKLMILLESYAYDNKKEIYTSIGTLALRSGQSDRTIRRNLKQLEHKQFIKMEARKGRHYTRLIYR